MLREYRRSYAIERCACEICGRLHPLDAKKCHPCNNKDLKRKECTKESRIAEYFHVLRQVELWPSVEPFKTCSVKDVVFRFSCTEQDLRHQCAAGLDCPLRIVLQTQRERLRQTFDTVEGLCFICMKRLGAGVGKCSCGN